jgi:TRAP-type C4-dicarboxylate transport system permease small subunit
MPSIKPLFSLLKHLSVGMAVVAGLSVFVLAFFIATDVVARRLFDFSLQGSDEIGGYVLAMIAAIGFSYVLFERGFTRIDILVKIMPKPVGSVIHVLAYVSLAAIAIFFAQKAIHTLEDTLLFDSHSNTPLQTPLWIPQGIWVVGASFFAICATLYAFRALVLYFTDTVTLEAECGFPNFVEEIAEITELTQKVQARSRSETDK